MNSPVSRLLRLAAIPALALVSPLLPAADGWETDFEAAKATAAKEKKDLLIDFTGSDWCVWCIRLKDEVFSKDAFRESAPKQFVLVELDFPEGKEQSEELVKQNRSLQEEFQIQGFPTVILADQDGRPYAQTGYMEGGPDEYNTHLAELRKIRDSRDAAFAKAAKLEGPEKAAALHEGVKAIDPALVASHYQKEIDEIISLDPNDKTGLRRERELAKKKDALEEKLMDHAENQKFDEFEAEIDRFIEAEKLDGTERQELLLVKLRVYGPDKLDKADALVDEVIRVDEKSRLADEARELKLEIAKIRKAIEESKDADKDADDKPADEPKDEAKEDK